MGTHNLPEWLDELLPEMKRPVEMFLDGNMLAARYPNGSVDMLSENIEEAYDKIHGDGIDILFSDAVYDKFARRDQDGETMFRLITVPSSDGYTQRLLTSRTDQDRLDSLERDWDDAQEAYREWKNDPDDFFKAYMMVDTHPAFWTRAFPFSSADNFWDENSLWSWETSGYCQQLWSHPWHDEDGRLYWAIEGGSHVADSTSTWRDEYYNKVQIIGVFQEHYHDFRLDAFGDTYEAAIVSFAHNVDKFFNPDGTEREDVEYEETPLEKTISKRTDEMERATGESWRKWHDSLPVVKFAEYGEWTRRQR